MTRTSARAVLMRFALACLALAATHGASAQFSGGNTPGDLGLQSGTQVLPGWYTSLFVYNYRTDDIRDRNGDEILPNVDGELDADAYAVIIDYASDYKILGGNYSFELVLPFGRSKLEAPALGISDKVSTDFSDIYFRPISLGWYTDRADYMAGFSVTLPTGDYEYLADGNDGLGMYSYEVAGGTTVYFNDAKTWHLAGTLGYEWHSKKEDTDIRVGDLLTLEGGLGYSWMDGLAMAGVAFYGQWKVSRDELGEAANLLPPADLALVGKHRRLGAGAEISLPIITDGKLRALVDLRWLREFENRSEAQGDSIVLTFTFPTPSVPLQ